MSKYSEKYGLGTAFSDIASMALSPVEQRRVALDERVNGKWAISTVNNGRCYETMVFSQSSWDSGSGMTDLDMEEYDTREAAVEGHKQMLAKWATKESAE